MLVFYFYYEKPPTFAPFKNTCVYVRQLLSFFVLFVIGRLRVSLFCLENVTDTSQLVFFLAHDKTLVKCGWHIRTGTYFDTNVSCALSSGYKPNESQKNEAFVTTGMGGI